MMGYTQTHEGWSRAQKQVLRQRQAQKIYIQYVHTTHVNGYTKTHVGWYKVLKQRKRYIDTRDVPIPKFEPIPVPIPILKFKAKPIPILNRYRYRYLDFSVLKFIYTYTVLF